MKSLISNFNLFISNFILDIPLFIIMVVFLIVFLNKRITKNLSYFMYFIVGIFCTFIAKNHIFMFIIYFISNFIIFKFKRSLRFNKDIFSLSMILNKFRKEEENDYCKIIGEVFPYNEYQIKHNRRKVIMDDTMASGHTLISGSSGSGKTYFMKNQIFQDIDNGNPIAFFEYKGDIELIKEIKEYANNKGYDIYELSSEETNFNYDPLSNLNDTAKVEALLNTRKWSTDGADAHYRTGTQLLIQKVIGDFNKLNIKNNYTLNLYKFLKQYNYDRSSYDAYTTMIKMIELLLTSNAGPMISGKFDKTFTFLNNKKYIVMFSFVSSNKELANSLSSLLYKDILESGKNKFYPSLRLYIDEYGTLENSMLVKDILEKGRSCGISTTISLQDINQIVINTNMSYLHAIMGTINNFIIFAGATKTTAEILAGVQVYEIDKLLVSLKKPIKDQKPTAMFISKYPTIEKDKSMDVFRIYPYSKNNKILNKNNCDLKENVENNDSNNIIKDNQYDNKQDKQYNNKEDYDNKIENIDYDSFI